MGFFIEWLTQLEKRNLQTFWPISDKAPPPQVPPPSRGHKDVPMVTLKLYTSCLSQSVQEAGNDLLSKHAQLQTAGVSLLTGKGH